MPQKVAIVQGRCGAKASPALQPWFVTRLAAKIQPQSPGIFLHEKCENCLGIRVEILRRGGLPQVDSLGRDYRRFMSWEEPLG